MNQALIVPTALAGAHPTSLNWFTRHEARLIWRDWLFMMTAGQKTRRRNLIIGVSIAAIVMHFLAYAIISSWATSTLEIDKPLLVSLTGTGLLSFCLMISQSLETITRAYYQRADLDLILASPAPASRLFAIRTLVAGMAATALSSLLFGPVINMLALRAGPQWLCAYLVLIALGALATAISVLATQGLFALFGPKRTRLVAQILAALVGAGFLIGIQAAAILSFGRISQFELFTSDAMLALAPAINAPLYWPARAAMGDPATLAALLFFAAAALGATIFFTSRTFADKALVASTVASDHHNKTQHAFTFSAQSPFRTLMRKEFKLLRRDPWLLSQTLMQILYLLPPALLLFVNYGQKTGAYAIIVPVITMAAGQLAGGLAWLAISGEDAPDLVETAPVDPALIRRAKAASVLLPLALVLAPILLALGIASPIAALIALAGALAASCSALTIQLWFRVRAKRAQFRRRQVASKTATLAEALVSIMWAGTAGIAAAGQPVAAIVPALIALATLGFVRRLRPAAL